LQVSNNYFVAGGSDRYFMELSQAQRAIGHTVIPFAPDDERNDPSEFSRYFPDALQVENPRVSDAIRYVYSSAAKNSLKRLLENTTIDVAHLHIYYGRLTASILPILKSRKIPVVQTVHDFKLLCAVYSCLRNGKICEECGGKGFWKAALYRCNRGSLPRSVASTIESYVSKSLGSHTAIDRYIAVSDFQRERLIEVGVCSADRISTIHNFVDAEKYVPATGPGSYACYFGRIEKLKGIATLVECMRQLPDIQLKLVGSGTYLAECRTKLRAENISNVELCGFQSGEALADIIRGAFCTVVPTEAYENCPMAVLESMAYARPVIGTAIGGIPELVSDGDDGLLIPVADEDSMASAICRLAYDQDLSIRMGNAGRAKIEAKFNAATHLKKINLIYEDLIGNFTE